jgi:hypothetical protein
VGVGEVADVDLFWVLAVLLLFLCLRGRGGRGAYIAPETSWGRDFVAAVEERIEHIRRVVYLFDIRNGLDRRPEDQCWEEDGDGEVWLVLFHEFPDGFVGFLFADTVGDVGVLGFLGVFYCKLMGLLVRGLLGGWIGEGRGTNWEP